MFRISGCVLRNLVLTLLFLAAPPAATLEVIARAKACDADRKREGELQEGRCRALAGEAKKGSRERKKKCLHDSRVAQNHFLNIWLILPDRRFVPIRYSLPRFPLSDLLNK
jgi:hypothetical protein